MILQTISKHRKYTNLNKSIICLLAKGSYSDYLSMHTCKPCFRVFLVKMKNK